MRYLIDTDWVIDHFHQIEAVVSKLEELAPQGLAISVITLAELYEGVYYSVDPAESEAVLQRFLDPDLSFLGSMKRPAKYSAASEADCGLLV